MSEEYSTMNKNAQIGLALTNLRQADTFYYYYAQD
jgi:hypothetical protein